MTVSKWKSYMWIADCEMNRKVIFPIMNTTKTGVKIWPGNNSGLYGILTHDLYHTGAVLYKLS